MNIYTHIETIPDKVTRDIIWDHVENQDWLITEQKRLLEQQKELLEKLSSNLRDFEKRIRKL